MRKGVYIIILLLLMMGCSLNDEQETLKSEIKNSFPESIQVQKIHHIEVVRDGVLVFYSSLNNGLDAGFLRKKSSKWKWVMGAGTVRFGEEFNWIISNDKEIPLSYVYGFINNPDIEKLTIESTEEKKKVAKIVTLQNGQRVWFAFYEYGIDGRFDYVGLGENGEIVKEY
ncbi:hypothetical protein [Pontibacillus marinus]|uniref:Uncharacterized protein n=1 Tax=Pontibacillus marinus BH030004 = DSM 16465 TaxID=1385511 RepID=A0A0A5HU30_9BACI|nr:hypothetical protein [Pontibacillus marinus]KGX87152.1 hypothetical protein N783_10545 [Pontibacillus marinus BH030004 = DSM 16465]